MRTKQLHYMSLQYQQLLYFDSDLGISLTTLDVTVKI
jgi:hypothetical protein